MGKGYKWDANRTTWFPDGRFTERRGLVPSWLAKRRDWLEKPKNLNPAKRCGCLSRQHRMCLRPVRICWRLRQQNRHASCIPWANFPPGQRVDQPPNRNTITNSPVEHQALPTTNLQCCLGSQRFRPVRLCLSRARKVDRDLPETVSSDAYPR